MMNGINFSKPSWRLAPEKSTDWRQYWLLGETCNVDSSSHVFATATKKSSPRREVTMPWLNNSS